MSTFQDIRTRFAVALVNEANRKNAYSQDASKEVRDILLKNRIRGNKTQNLSELRFGISGDPKTTQQWLIDNVLSDIESGNYTVTYEEPDRAKKGDAKSGTYYTHKITVINPFKIGSYNAQEGDAIYIIDNLKAKSNIQNKMLTPDGLALADNTYKDLATLRSDVEKALKNYINDGSISEPHYDFMLDLLDGIINGVKPTVGHISDVKAGHSDIIVFSSNGVEEHISEPDIAKIAKDFGEVLGGAYLFNLTGGGGLGLYFPRDSNEPLVDFQIDGQAISMKAGAGAAPSLSNVGALIARDPEKWKKLMSSDEQKLMLEVVKTFYENEAAAGVFRVAELINAPGFELLKTLLSTSKLKAADIDKNVLSEWVRSSFKQDPEGSYDKFDTYFKALGKFPDGWNNKQQQIDDAIARKEAFGLIMSPLAYHIKDLLNNNTLLVDALAEVVQKFDVLQLYIDLKLNKTKQYQKYTLKKFAEGKFLFNATPSVNLPTRNKFGFKMVK